MDLRITNISLSLVSKVMAVKVKDVLWAIDVITKITEFSEELGKIIRALNKNMIDVSNLDPSNFEDLLKIAMALNEEGIIDVDIDNLRQLHKDILELDTETITKAIAILQEYISVIDSLKTTIRDASSRMYVSKDELMFVKGLMSGKREKEDMYTTEMVNEITAEELEQIKRIISNLKT